MNLEKKLTKKKINKVIIEPEGVDKEEKVSKKKVSEKKDKVKIVDHLKEMEARLESVEQEAKEAHDRFLRVSAEFENYKKRSAREMDEFRKFANESLLREMLTVVDNLERALNSSNNDNQANSHIAEGVDMTLKEILKVFEKFNVKPIEALGKPFDPNFHQAAMREETNERPENTVLNELEKGYMIHDRLLRPAMVVVSMPKVNAKD
ncbi:MAG: nucleotide exchange factor GrpE [Deltaproteobacteria bacterium]|nr:nucleotide exchange factor GrpE [Deltaproteobacteria bacterium]